MYGIGKTVDYSYDEAIEKITGALKEQGFGVLTTIDVKETLKQKIGVDFNKYVILGACNPNLAYQALQSEEEIGLLLPCNVIVYEGKDGKTHVSVLNPLEALGIVDNDRLGAVAEQAHEKLRAAIGAI